MEPKTCPKCGKSMSVLEYAFGLPIYLDQRVLTKSGDKVTTRQALEIQVHRCEACRFLELYSAQ
jgi:predicted nucleic-acid-binding Zn-ribbon protein